MWVFLLVLWTHVVVLSFLTFFQIVLLSFQLHNTVPKIMGLCAEIISAESVNAERFDTDGQGNSLFLFQLLLGLVPFNLGGAEVWLYRRKYWVLCFCITVWCLTLRLSFLVMVKLGPCFLLCSLSDCIMAWRFFSTSSRRRRFSSISRCFFSSISRTRLSSSCFLRSAIFFSSSARVTLRLACFSLSRLRSSSSLARCLRHSVMYSLSCSSKSDLFWSWRYSHAFLINYYFMLNFKNCHYLDEFGISRLLFTPM